MKYVLEMIYSFILFKRRKKSLSIWQNWKILKKKGMLDILNFKSDVQPQKWFVSLTVSEINLDKSCRSPDK